MANAPDPIAESIIRSNAEIAKAERIRAAAPALLEALVSAESAMMEAYPYVVDTPSNEAVRWTMRAMLDAIKQARAAIAQARGEKS